MAGVWVFRNGVAKLVQNPMVEPIDGQELSGAMSTQRRKALVYLPTMEIICSIPHLQDKLLALGWLPYSASQSQSASAIAIDSHQIQSSTHHHAYTSHDSDLLLVDNRGRSGSPAFSDDDHHHHHHHHQQQHHHHHHGSMKHHHSHRSQNHHGQDQSEDESKQLVQFHRCFSSSLLISLPRDFSKFKTMHMYDIVLKNRQYFEVRDCNYQY